MTDQNQTQSKGRQPDYIIHTTDSTDQNAPWHRIGAAWQNKNGYLTANLAATPTNGKLILQPKEELEKLRAQKQEQNQTLKQDI